MAISLSQSATAVSANVPASFLASGGTAPYVFSIVAGGAGGTINASTGSYFAPNAVSSDPTNAFDIVQVVDSLAATATAQILVGSPLLLFCDIIQNQMNLAPGRTYLFDQKIFQPSDNSLYIAVSVPVCKPWANMNQILPTIGGMTQFQTVNVMATLDVNVISRGPDALVRKEEVLLALNSVYSQQQQQANSFLLGVIPPSSQFVNLSNIDGAAIPYRFKISIFMQYSVAKQVASQYFNRFSQVQRTVSN